MKTAILLTWFATIVFGLTLRILNMTHLKRHGRSVPRGFDGSITEEELGLAVDYTVAKSHLDLAQNILEQSLLFFLLFGGLLPLYDRWITTLCFEFVPSGTLFFLGLFSAQTILISPFSLYRTFRLEARFNFNKTTFGTWISDLFKSFAIGAILLALLAIGGLILVAFSPGFWWLWVWIFLTVATLTIMFISPYVIEPLFFKYEPITNPSLEEGIRTLMQKEGLKVDRVLQVDASRRSSHSNAYFTGIGRVKRIVLYDTLLDQMEENEILAILAHEIGHWKKAHLFKRLVQTGALSLASLYLAHILLSKGIVSGFLDLSDLSFAAQTVILAFLANLVLFPLAPLFNTLSRRDERQADLYASRLTGDPHSLASALVKLSRENLSNLHPHPLYAFFHYSHPPVPDRIESLLSLKGDEKTG